VPSQPLLMASSLGRVLLDSPLARPTYGRLTKASRTAKHSYYGYYCKRIGNVKVHRAVCEAFHGVPPFEGAVVIHQNENAHDNHPINLKWGTQKENLNMPGFLSYCRSRLGENSPVIKGLCK
jgi:hypothetical protein